MFCRVFSGVMVLIWREFVKPPAVISFFEEWLYEILGASFILAGVIKIKSLVNCFGGLFNFEG